MKTEKRAIVAGAGPGLGHALCQVLLDGAMWGPQARDRFKLHEQQCISPQAVAKSCLMLIEQPARAWTHELDIRTQDETF